MKDKKAYLEQDWVVSNKTFSTDFSKEYKAYNMLCNLKKASLFELLKWRYF